MTLFTCTEQYVEVIVDDRLVRAEVFYLGSIKHCQINGTVYEIRRLA